MALLETELLRDPVEHIDIQGPWTRRNVWK
jgi:hypothetical protein